MFNFFLYYYFLLAFFFPLPQLLLGLQIYFEQPPDTFIKVSGSILIKLCQALCFGVTRGFLKFQFELAASGTVSNSLPQCRSLLREVSV